MKTFDDNFDEYMQSIERRMWKGLAISVLVFAVLMTIIAVTQKPEHVEPITCELCD